MARIYVKLSLVGSIGLLLVSCGPALQSQRTSNEPQPVSAKILVPGPVGTEPILAIPAMPATQIPMLTQTRTATADEINQCIESVCGPATDNTSTFEIPKSRRPVSEKFQKNWAEFIVPQIKEALHLELVTGKLMAEHLKIAMKDGFQLSAEQSNSYQAIIGATVALRNAFDVLSGSVHIDVKTTQVTLDQNRFKEKLSTVPSRERKAFDKLFELHRENLMLMAAEGGKISIASLKRRIKKIDPELSEFQSLVKEAGRVKARIQVFQINLGPLVVETFFGAIDRVADKVLQSKDLSYDDSATFASGSLITDFYASAFEEKNKQVFATSAADVDLSARRLKRGSHSLALIERWSADQTGTIDKTLATCRDRFEKTMDLGNEDIARTLKIIAQVKTAAKVVARKLVEEADDLKALEAKISDTEFAVAERGSDRIKVFQDFLQRKLQGEKALQIAAQKSVPEFRNMILLVSILSDLQARRDEKLQRPETDSNLELEKQCEIFTEMRATDAAFTYLGRINVSWFTTVVAEVAPGIIAHELGHVVSGEARRLSLKRAQEAPFNNSLKCVANRNPSYQEPVSISSSENTAFSEEDWADHFSSLALNELRRTGVIEAKRSKNMGCALVGDGGDRYMNNGFEVVKGETHSSGLLRLLMVANDSNQMTSQCEPLLSYARAYGKELKCQ